MCLHFTLHIQQDNFCPSYGITFIYEVNITSLRSNRLYCTDDLSCTTSFNNLTGMVEEFVVSIKAQNEYGSGDLLVYPTTIGMLIYYSLLTFMTMNYNLYHSLSDSAILHTGSVYHRQSVIWTM